MTLFHIFFPIWDDSSFKHIPRIISNYQKINKKKKNGNIKNILRKLRKQQRQSRQIEKIFVSQKEVRPVETKITDPYALKPNCEN